MKVGDILSRSGGHTTVHFISRSRSRRPKVAVNKSSHAAEGSIRAMMSFGVASRFGPQKRVEVKFLEMAKHGRHERLGGVPPALEGRSSQNAANDDSRVHMPAS